MPFITPSRKISSQAQLGANTVGTEQLIDGDITVLDIGTNAVADDEIAAHTTTKITVPTSNLFGTIAEAQIANDAVTLAKMAPGTDGNIISFDANGNAVAIATGTANQVLTSAGAGAPPAFGSVPPVNIFVPTFSITGGWTSILGDSGHVEMPATGRTKATGSVFVVINTISKIEFIYLSLDEFQHLKILFLQPRAIVGKVQSWKNYPKKQMLKNSM